MLAIVGVAACIRLGDWQTDRAQQKLQIAEAMQQRANAPAIHVGTASLNAAEVEFRSVEARGEFDPKGMVLLDNRVSKGRVGYEVIMPLRLAGTDMHLLINRGWIAGTGDRRRLPEVVMPRGEVSITGVAVIPGRTMYELSAETTENAVWQNLSIERYVERMRYKIQPVLVRQTNDAPDGLLRDWRVSDREINVHRSYAFQWFALAALILVVYLVLSFKRDSSNA